MGTHPIFESDFDCLTEFNGQSNAVDMLASSYILLGDVVDGSYNPSILF